MSELKTTAERSEAPVRWTVVQNLLERTVKADIGDNTPIGSESYKAKYGAGQPIVVDRCTFETEPGWPVRAKAVQ